MHLLDFNKSLEKNLDGNNTRMLLAVLKKSWKQNPKRSMYGCLPSMSEIIHVRWARHAGQYSEIKTNILAWTPTHGHTSTGWPAKTYMHQLCADTLYSQENSPRARAYKERWWVKVKWNYAVNRSWCWRWWWWWWCYGWKTDVGFSSFNEARLLTTNLQ